MWILQPERERERERERGKWQFPSLWTELWSSCAKLSQQGANWRGFCHMPTKAWKYTSKCFHTRKCCFKPVWNSLFCATQKMIFWRNVNIWTCWIFIVWSSFIEDLHTGLDWQEGEYIIFRFIPFNSRCSYFFRNQACCCWLKHVGTKQIEQDQYLMRNTMCMPPSYCFKLKVACSLFTWTGSEIHTQLHTICIFKPLLIWNGHIATHEQHSTSKKCYNHLAFNNKSLSAKQA